MSEEILIALVAGLIAGGGIAWFLATSKAGGTIAELRSQLSQQQMTFQTKEQEISRLSQQLRAEGEEKVAAITKLQSLEDAEKRLSDTFDALAGRVLTASNEHFLQLASESFKGLRKEAEGELETRKQAIEGLVRPLSDSLQRYEQQIQAIEGARQVAYGGLQEQVRNLQEVTGNL